MKRNRHWRQSLLVRSEYRVLLYRASFVRRLVPDLTRLVSERDPTLVIMIICYNLWQKQALLVDVH